ncbi:hypothetical protein F1559_004761 [Cyanidiococcus yangmingshanensis]|uniref:Uncharacterized protein n=1 Tax=Cyanidiococcus yangmingshanensis TaxID=2690220 RepID=A0A7J7IRP2_9RHOD|nr:hypothetical protein F1559_004761 [Cyanidiococcus yangmingshanensis]
MGDSANPSLPRGCTRVRCERLFFTLWPRTDDGTGLDQQHAALTTSSNDPLPSAEGESRSRALGSKNLPQSALADLAATTLAIDYNYQGLDESLHFRAEMVRLRTELSRYLGPQGELVVVPLLHVRYQVSQKLPMASTPQPEVRIQLDAARVLLDWTIVQRIWSEFSDAQAAEKPLERVSPSESTMAREERVRTGGASQ